MGMTEKFLNYQDIGTNPSSIFCLLPPKEVSDFNTKITLGT